MATHAQPATTLAGTHGKGAGGGTLNRLERLREILAERDLLAWFSTSPPDNQYLTGFLTSLHEVSAALLITADAAIFLTDSRYTEQAQEQVAEFEVEQMSGDLLTRAGERMRQLGVTRTGFDPAAVSVADLQRFREAFAGECEGVLDVVNDMRIQKSAGEIETVRAASNLAESVLADIPAWLEPGLTERDLAARIEYEMKRRGATAGAFDTIALFGARSSLPHGEPGDRALKKGDVVLLDFGCRRNGYCSDLTRTYAFGSIPGSWFEEVYGVVLTAQLKALEAVAPGRPCREVDAIARDHIKACGFGERFGHALGHGVGIEIHEAPRVNPRSDAILQEGMIITLEPGVYVPGKGGVRIEDLVAVTATGCDVLTASSKALKVISS
ncbi:MAG: Xaa-Pro peptidase family protein [Candidatus Hydrogenedentales bacterium]